MWNYVRKFIWCNSISYVAFRIFQSVFLLSGSIFMLLMVLVRFIHWCVVRRVLYIDIGFLESTSVFTLLSWHTVTNVNTNNVNDYSRTTVWYITHCCLEMGGFNSFREKDFSFPISFQINKTWFYENRIFQTRCNIVLKNYWK